MSSSFEVLFGDKNAVEGADPDFYEMLDTVDVEENVDQPGAFQFTMPVATFLDGDGEDLTVVGDDRFRPYSRVAIVVSVDEQSDACIFDGYVLAHTVQLDRGTTASAAQVWGQDSSCLMNLVDKTHPWTEKDGEIANTIFAAYSFRGADGNRADDDTAHPLEGHVLMQRGTDLQFLRERARRTGRLLRVCCDAQPGEYVGYFIKPNLRGEAVMTLTLNPLESANVESLKFSWDVLRPTKVMANALFGSTTIADGAAEDSGLSSLGERSLRTFAGSDHAMNTRLTTNVGDAGELVRRSESLLREAGWFVKCEGEADLASLGTVMRVGTLVQVDGAGAVHSGKYFVWTVRHTISAISHRISFVLVRNAVGAP